MDLFPPVYYCLIKRYSHLARCCLRPESIITKLCGINITVARFHLVFNNVQDPNWWYFKALHGLIYTKGVCFGFGDNGWFI